MVVPYLDVNDYMCVPTNRLELLKCHIDICVCEFTHFLSSYFGNWASVSEPHTSVFN